MNPPQMNSARAAAVISVAGLDPGCGAGLARDVLTAAALGFPLIAIGTAWTEQSSIHRVEARDPDAVEDALRHALARHAGAGVKVGMVPNLRVANAIISALDGAGFSGPVVVDPVLFASRGGALWADSPRALLPLLRRATLVTPNAPEAAALSGLPVMTASEAVAAAEGLRRQGVAAVLVKGGHLSEGLSDEEPGTVTDLLVGPDGLQRFSRPRIAGLSPRGTGCALSTAIAGHLATGVGLRAAVEAATAWLATQIAAAIDVNGERHLP